MLPGVFIKAVKSASIGETLTNLIFNVFSLRVVTVPKSK